MSMLESLIFGLVSGLTEFLPVSSQAHQALLFRIFGMPQREPIRDLLVHVAVLLSLVAGCRGLFSRIQRESKLAASSKRSRIYELKGLYDLRLVKTASVPLLLGLLLYIAVEKLETRLLYIALFSIINGILLIITEHIRQGNKEASSMTGMDAVLIGLSGALSSLPGVSRIGAVHSIAVIRGADQQHALNWAYLLSIPALIVFLIFDFVHMISYGIGIVSFAVIVGYLLSAVAAFVGGYLSILFARRLIVRAGLTGFAYYSWGAALFAFLIYLIT